MSWSRCAWGKPWTWTGVENVKEYSSEEDAAKKESLWPGESSDKRLKDNKELKLNASEVPH